MINKMDEILQKVDTLPLLPSITAEIIKLTDDPDTTVISLEQAICKDQALTGQVLKLANSAYYGFPRRITTISKAVLILGFNTIRGIVIAASTYPFLKKQVDGYELEKGELWKHSMAVAICARFISKKYRHGDPNEAFIAGLLHDIGKTLLNVYVKEDYQRILYKIEKEQVSFIQAEKEILGFNHAEIGGKVAEKWNLPPEFVHAIAYHHEPTQENECHQLTYIVHLADIICSMLGIGLGNDGLLYAVSGEAIEALNFKENDIDSIMSEMKEILVDMDNFTDM